MLQTWKALSRLPLELALQHEAACARCRRPCASHVSAMLALPLTLPTAEVKCPEYRGSLFCLQTNALGWILDV